MKTQEQVKVGGEWFDVIEDRGALLKIRQPGAAPNGRPYAPQVVDKSQVAGRRSAKTEA